MNKIYLAIFILLFIFILKNELLSDNIKYLVFFDNSKLTCNELFKEEREEPSFPLFGMLNDSNIKDKKIVDIYDLFSNRFKLKDITMIIKKRII
jgi:hypothetical protein